MPNAPQHRHQDIYAREAFYYRVFAGVLCAACLTFGLLNLWDIV